MDVVHKGYWLGESISYIDKNFVRELEQYFYVIDCGYDVSVLSEDEIRFCFFYYQPKFQGLFQTAAKLCKNLDKKLVLLYQRALDFDADLYDCILDSIDVDSFEQLLWCDALNQKINHQFSDHQDILDLDSLAEQREINKDLVEILKYIDNNLSRTIREEDVADYCHYSTTYFSKFFHKTIGVSFRDYLTHKRINLAKQLLVKDKKEKISFIAFQCGYNDVSYFSRIFKKKTGVTPATYRQIH